ncbi:hypothetical protein CAEBREN_02834 [Caenorhabditis brenneri]|uniref:Tubby-like protein n=1 Tax=Caenorhabditis brenneri TaxID=135651 RepID=G0P5U4_CAEBE|nr:hypothetical protein CAEBREN_02834 [Caenorhabditis brenneri]
MAEGNNPWIEQNLQRQRKMLEEKQKQKRHQSAGSVRTNSSSMTMNSMKDYPTFDTTAPSSFGFSDSLSSNMTIPLISAAASGGPPVAPPRAQSMTRHSPPTTEEALISINDYSDNEISTKLSKQNLNACVASDDEDDRSSITSPWHNDVIEDRIPSEILPNYNYIKANLAKFVEEPGQEHCQYKCSITRQKSGVDKGMFPTYYLHLEEVDSDRRQKIFLLAARKRKKSTTANYLLSTDPTNLSREGDGYCAKVRSNALGTQFTVYDAGQNPKKTSNQLSIRQELAAETNVLGFKGPRKMTIIMPGIEPPTDTKPATRCTVRPIQDKHTLLERYRLNELDSLKVLCNKSPQWNDDSQSYVLNFHGRVTQASVKNFQIIHASSPEYIVMQFGRISDDEFTMDFRYPLSAVQAFGIAMTSFHGKLACE